MPDFIEIAINDEGEIESEVKGVLGPDCEGLADWLEELGDVVEHRRTPDYYRRQAVGSRVTVGR
jgi:hypothetical protein